MKKKIIICICFLLVLSGCSVSDNDVKEATTQEEQTYEEIMRKETTIQLEYPDKISYPGIKKLDIFVTNYPMNAVYCKISTNLGSTSVSKIYLEKENQITYYLPDNFDIYMFDSILFEFYDEYSQFIEGSKIAIHYDMDMKEVQISKMIIEEPLTEAQEDNKIHGLVDY